MIHVYLYDDILRGHVSRFPAVRPCWTFWKMLGTPLAEAIASGDPAHSDGVAIQLRFKTLGRDGHRQHIAGAEFADRHRYAAQAERELLPLDRDPCPPDRFEFAFERGPVRDRV